MLNINCKAYYYFDKTITIYKFYENVERLVFGYSNHL